MGLAQISLCPAPSWCPPPCLHCNTWVSGALPCHRVCPCLPCSARHYFLLAITVACLPHCIALCKLCNWQLALDCWLGVLPSEQLKCIHIRVFWQRRGKLGGYRGRHSSSSGPVRGGSAILGQCPYPGRLHLSSSQEARPRGSLPAVHYQGQHVAHLAFCSPGFAGCQACTACTEARVGGFTMPSFYVRHMTCIHPHVVFSHDSIIHLFNGNASIERLLYGIAPLCNFARRCVLSQALYVLSAAFVL